MGMGNEVCPCCGHGKNCTLHICDKSDCIEVLAAYNRGYTKGYKDAPKPKEKRKYAKGWCKYGILLGRFE